MTETAVRRRGRPRIVIHGSHAPLIRRLYWDENRPVAYIARLYGVSTPTMGRWMAEHGIPRRPARGPGTGRAGGIASTGHLRQYNARRTQDAAQAGRIEAALARLGDRVSPVHAEAARLRIAHPGDSLSELGTRAGVTRDVIAGRLRRLVAMANELED
jgi:WhiA C-terminal HTH domain